MSTTNDYIPFLLLGAFTIFVLFFITLYAIEADVGVACIEQGKQFINGDCIAVP